jgi:hypothetical protein
MTQELTTVAESNAAEAAWYERCPKPALFEIALQLAILATGDEDRRTALARLTEEWEILSEAHLLPDRPPVASMPEPPPQFVQPSMVANHRGMFETLRLRLHWPSPR